MPPLPDGTLEGLADDGVIDADIKLLDTNGELEITGVLVLVAEMIGEVITVDGNTTLLLPVDAPLDAGVLNDGTGEWRELNEGEGEEWKLVGIGLRLLEDGAGTLYRLVVGETIAVDVLLVKVVLGV